MLSSNSIISTTSYNEPQVAAMLPTGPVQYRTKITKIYYNDDRNTQFVQSTFKNTDILGDIPDSLKMVLESFGYIVNKNEFSTRLVERRRVNS